MANLPRTAEGAVARWAAIALSASFILPVICVFALLVASRANWPLIGAVALLAIVYLAQISYLTRIDHYGAFVRRRIWLTSLGAHLVMLLPALAYIVWERSPLGVLALLAPELISAALHVRGVSLNSRAIAIA